MSKQEEAPAIGLTEDELKDFLHLKNVSTWCNRDRHAECPKDSISREHRITFSCTCECHVSKRKKKKAKEDKA